MSRNPSITPTRFPVFQFQDAVRVQAQLVSEKEEPLKRRFSVDPQLTNFDILRNLIGRAFDMKGDYFAISYKVLDDFGGETFLPMVSDWDLSAAFLSASDPDLQLIVESRDFPLNMENGSPYMYDEEPWEVIKSNEVIHQSSPFSNLQSRSNPPYSSSSAAGTPTSQNNEKQIPLAFNPKINTAGIFNTMERWVQKAKTFVEDISVVTSRPPLSDVEFRNFLDLAGVLCRPRELRYAVYHGGVEPSLRKVVWKHLLNVYPEGLTGSARIEYIRNKSKDYYELRDVWKLAMQNGQISEEVLCISNMVRKDVLRTDRHLKFFAGHDDNQNLAILFNILTTYSLNHPKVGYCQGMSDLASPLLVIMGDEAQAYICLCALMDRIKPNFYPDGLAMSLKFAHLAEALAYYDSYYWEYLKSVGADDLLFCYRWLLLELKREFAFEDSLRMFEVLWATLPSTPKNVKLFEVKWEGSTSNSIPIGLPAMTSSYTKVCAIRRTNSSSNELRNRRFMKSSKPKACPNLSLDENSIISLSSSTPNHSNRVKTNSSKPYYSLDDNTMEILSMEDFKGIESSSFEIISQSNISPSANIINSKSSPRTKPKLVRNLKEFWNIGRGQSLSKSNSCDDSTSLSSSSLGHKEDEELHKSLKRSSSVELDGNLKENDYVFLNNKANEDGSLISDKTLTNNCDNLETQFGRIDLEGTGDPNQAIISQPGNNHIEYNKEATTKQEQDEEEDRLRKEKHSIADSENDSGHCESLEHSICEPEFQTGARIRPKIPCPEEFGGGNPFLMFLSLTLLLQHRDHVIMNQLDYNCIGMFYDKMIRKHNVMRVLGQAREMYSTYMKQSSHRA